MNIVDILIIALLILGAIKGFSNGVLKQTVSFLGLIVVIILAFIFKNPLSVFMYENLPFINFDGIFKGITALNILVYEAIAFFVVLGVLLIVLKIVLFVTKIVEKVLTLTIILGIPSKLLGLVVGILEAYVYAYIALYILSNPGINIKELDKSTLKPIILNKTPILNDLTSGVSKSMTEVIEIKDKYKDKEINSDELNKEVIDVLLKNKVTNVTSLDKLVSKGKIKVENIEEVLSKYRKE